MTDTEIFLTVYCSGLLALCFLLNRRLDIQSKWLITLQRAVVQLQGVAMQQVAINEKSAEVQSILEDVNVSLKKIVEGEKA